MISLFWFHYTTQDNYLIYLNINLSQSEEWRYQSQIVVSEIWEYHISIVRKFFVSGIMVNDEYKESVIRTPQGGNLSPLLANIMLNKLDKEMEKRGLNFVDTQTTVLLWSEVKCRQSE